MSHDRFDDPGLLVIGTDHGAESTTGVTYGGSANGANGWYSDIAPGQYTLSGRIASAT